MSEQHAVDHRTEPLGVPVPPSEIEAQVNKKLGFIKALTIAALVLFLAAVFLYLASVYNRGSNIESVVKTLQVDNGPEAQAASDAYLNLIRLQIDCDGRIREQESDNALVERVAEFVPDLVGEPPIDLASNARSCRGIPKAQEEFDRAQVILDDLRAKADD